MRLPKYLFFIFYFLFFIFYFPGFARAEDCADTSDSEYHSLRPYPAEPCNEKKENLSYICGNDMVLTDKIRVPWTEGNCTGWGAASGTLTCDYDLERGFTVEVDPSQSELPIMGNTEDVIPNANPDMSDVQKVTEYVSWYLNGVINRAEYAFLSWNNPEDIKKIINLSGPIRKLLPQRIQDNKSLAAITGIVEEAATREKQVDDAKRVRHNQIVACTYGINLPTFISFFGGQIGAIPGPCKDLGIFSTFFKKEHRLRTETSLTEKDPGWEDHLPPKREDYISYQEYYEDYRKWRGDKCFSIPIPFLGGLEIMLCFDNPLNPNFYGDLYPYIPFSSTEDRVGDLEVTKPIKTGGEVEVVDPIFDICREEEAGVNCFPGDPRRGPWDLDKPANYSALHFAHMQEDKELSLTLQSTFVPKDGTDQELGYTEPPKIGPGCKILDVRSNPGDKLDPYPFPKDDKEVSLGRFSYRAQFTCTFYYYHDALGVLRVTPPFCIKTAVFTSKINVGSPLADEIWAQTVAGNSAIFKMIFPKLNVAGAPGAIKDIPGTTPIGYESNPYLTAAAAVDPKAPVIYFPHIGGVYEYFLKGIQTILRPKGYGESISFGGGSGAPTATACNYSGSIDAAIANAASQYNVPTALLRAIYQIEGTENILDPTDFICYENVATAAGVTQITRGAYEDFTCGNEEMADDLTVCKNSPEQLSRCDPNDAFELAARILLYHAGYWNRSQCTPIGTPAWTKMEIYNAACKYYGGFEPDTLTIHAASYIPVVDRRQDGDMNYCDIICYKMGLCPPYPAR